MKNIHLQTFFPIYVISLVSVVLTLFVFSYYHQEEELRLYQDLNSQSTTYSLALESKLSDVISEVRAVQDFFNSSEYVSKEEYLQYCFNLNEISTVSYIAWLPREGSILDPDDFHGDLNDLYLSYAYPISYIYPEEEYQSLVGIDWMIEPEYARVIRKTILSKTAITLTCIKSDNGDDYSLLVSMPYLKLKSITPNQQVSNLEGFFVARVDLGKTIESALIDFMKPDMLVMLNIQSLDRSLVDDNYVVVSSAGKEVLSPKVFETLYADKYAKTTKFNLKGHSLEITVAPQTAFVNKYLTFFPWLYLFIGMILTGIISYYLYHSITRLLVSDQTVIQRTKELERNKKRFEDLVFVSNDWIWEIDKRFHYKYTSRNVTALLGYVQDEMIGRSPFSFMSKEEGERIKNYVRPLVAKQEPIINMENWNQTKDGRSVCMLTNAVPFYDDNGEFIGYRGVDRDITEPKRMIEKLRFSEERYRSVQQNLLVGVYRATLDGKFLHANQALANIFGFSSTRELLELQDLLLLFNNQKEMKAFLKKHREFPDRSFGVVPMKKQNGGTVWIQFSGRLVKDTDGNELYIDGTFEDITHRKEIEDKLKESEQRFRSILESVRVGIFIINPQHHAIIYANQLAQEMTGFSQNELIEQDYLSILPAEDKTRIQSDQSLHSSENEEAVLTRKDGQPLPIIKTSTPITMHGKKYLLESFVDITHQKETESSLKESNEAQTVINKLLHLTFKATSFKQLMTEAMELIVTSPSLRLQHKAGLFLADEDERKLSLVAEINLSDSSHTMCYSRVFGSCLCGQVALDQKIKFHTRLELNEIPSCDKLETSDHYTLPILSKNQLLGVMNLFLKPNHKPSKNEMLFLESISAIIAGMIVKYKSEQSILLQGNALTATANAIVIWDANGIIKSINPAFTKLTGFTERDVVNKPIKLLKHERYDIELSQRVDKIIARGKSWHGEFENRRRDGTRYEEEMTITPIKDKDGAITHYIAVKQDITERKRAKEELERYTEELRLAYQFQEQNSIQLSKLVSDLEESREQAEIANQAKSQFLANISHEIRTPMNGIIGMTNLTLGTELTDEQLEYLKLVKTSADNLLEVINQVLDFSKIEAGQVELEEISFSLRDMLEDTIAPLIIKAQEKEVEIILYIPPVIPETVIGDPTRLRQVMINLVSNAVKFTHEGEILITVEITHDDNKPAFLFSVTDTGIGIPIEKQDLIFNSFTQADGSTTREYGGTGLGTTISKQIVEQMRGTIWFESPTNTKSMGGPGSTFYVQLPLAVSDNQEPRKILQHTELSNRRVLVVDTNETNRKYFQFLLEAWQMRVATAGSGEEALQLMQSKTGKDAFELLLIDSKLTDMNGIKLIEKVHQLKLQTFPQVIILTSERIASMKKLAEHSHIFGVYSKPIKEQYLFKYLCLAFSEDNESTKDPTDGGTPAKRPQQSVKVHGRNKTILLAEDNKINRLLVVKLLLARKYKVIAVENGEDAVETVINGDFDLILMDMHMPVMNGVEATTAIRDWEHETGVTDPIPIIAMTASSESECQDKCILSGMNEIIHKPIEPEKLFGMLEKYKPAKQSAEQQDKVT